MIHDDLIQKAIAGAKWNGDTFTYIKTTKDTFTEVIYAICRAGYTYSFQLRNPYELIVPITR